MVDHAKLYAALTELTDSLKAEGHALVHIYDALISHADKVLPPEAVPEPAKAVPEPAKAEPPAA